MGPNLSPLASAICQMIGATIRKEGPDIIEAVAAQIDHEVNAVIADAILKLERARGEMMQAAAGQ